MPIGFDFVLVIGAPCRAVKKKILKLTYHLFLSQNKIATIPDQFQQTNERTKV